MQPSGTPHDPALKALIDTRGSLGRMAKVTYLGLWFWLAILVLHAATLITGGSSFGTGWGLAFLEFLIIGIPVLMHIWPIRNLRTAAKVLEEFAAAPTEVRAAKALNAQSSYWRAALISHLIIVVWIVVLALGLARLFLASQAS